MVTIRIIIEYYPRFQWLGFESLVFTTTRNNVEIANKVTKASVYNISDGNKSN